METDYLIHYGVRGMRWGIRKSEESDRGSMSRKEYRRARKELSRTDKELKRSYSVARGKKLHEKGLTLGRIRARKAVLSIGAASVSSIASLALTKRGMVKAALAVKALGVMSHIVNRKLNKRDARDLRSYYAHTNDENDE